MPRGRGAWARGLNQPLSADLEEAFTAVVDCGSLEHVFDFPAAVRNCMRMVAVDGHSLSVTPADNWAGHGFYQFDVSGPKRR